MFHLLYFPHRAISLHHLPRTVSEESLTEETYTWRGTLETRERAVRKREKLLSEKEESVIVVQERLAELEQQTKELAIKDREYKLRYRGIEEREAREGDLPRRIAEITQREQEIEAKERALQRQLDNAHTTTTTTTNGNGNNNTPPDTLQVDVPSLYDMAGTYVLMDEQRKGRPQWESEGRLMYHEAGKWVVGFDYEADEGVAWVTSTQNHANQMPHLITSWSYAPGEGEDFEEDPAIRVTAK